MPEPKSFHKYRQYLLAGASAFLTLIALEGAVRTLWTDPDVERIDKILGQRGYIETALRHSKNQDRVYELRPNSQGLAWDTWVEINSLGFRGPETSIAKRDLSRITTVGDSITFGNSLPPNAAFPYQLQDRFQTSCPRLEVLNFAVGGYDVVQVVATVEDQVTQFDPDIVVWGFCLNDIAISSGNLEYFLRSSAFANSFVFRSHLLRYLYQQWTHDRVSAQIAAKNKPEAFAKLYRNKMDELGKEEKELREWMRQAGELARPTRMFSSEPHVARLRNSFRRLKTVAEASGFTVIILIVPILDASGDLYRHEVAHRIVEYEALRHGFEVVDPLDDFMVQDGQAWRIESKPGDRIHPNPQGHAVLAGSLYDHLQANHPSLCPSGDG